MTIEAARDAEPNVGKIIRSAYRAANLISEHQQLSMAKVSEGLDELSDIVDQLEAEGVFARSVSFEDVVLTAGEGSYELGSSVIGVRGTPVYCPPGEDPERPETPTYMRMVRREEFQRLSAKDEQAHRPTLAFEDRQTAPITVKLWQLPEEAGTIRFQVQRLRANTSNVTSTMDFERYWNQYFKYQLAHNVALSGGVELPHLMHLRGLAQEYLAKAKGRANETPHHRFRMGHRTPWS